MKKFLGRIFIFCISLIVVSFSVQYVIDSGLKRYNGDLFDDWNKIFKGKINASIIILGSSRAAKHYDPKVIENITGLSWII